jgi:hypothetical protein
MRWIQVAVTALVVVMSVSALVHAKKRLHVMLRPTVEMPAVNVP